MSVVLTLSVIVLCVVLHSDAQTTVVGPTDTVYVSPGESASFSCTVTWNTSGTVQSIQWGRSRDDGSNWNNIATCNNDGNCTLFGDYENVYSTESSGQNKDFFKLTVDSATLDEDAHYDCWPATASNPGAPYARLYVFYQVTGVTIYESEDPKTVEAGIPVIIKCTTTSGHPPADLFWTIGDNDITHFSENKTIETGDDTRLYDTESRLKYAFNAFDDQKYLTCQSFQHESFTPRSSQVLMNVEYAPVIHAIVVESWEGNTVTVECDASANPDDVTYSWESDDGQTRGNSRTWTLTDEDGDDEVNVTCNASNVKGETSLTKVISPHLPCKTLSIVFGCLFALTLALLILTFSLLFINGHGLRVLVKKKGKTSGNSPESTYQGLQRDVQQSSYTHLHIGSTNAAENPASIDLDIESTYASLEEDNKNKDNVYLKPGDVVEFPRSRLYLKDILCEGRFSKTMTGEAWFIGGKDGVSDVIVTVAKEDKSDFKREVEVMASLSKLKGVVEYLGCCITEDPMYLITEYAPNGTLLQVLENMKDADALKRKGPDLLTFALNVAESLQTLSENKIIHREIMAKNIVVDSQWQCKLSGLGSSNAVLTDQRYRQKMKGHLPIRWMAPEILSGNAYTIGSDMWSFGVLLWEVYSLGCTPYKTLVEDDVIYFIKGGKRLDIPTGCAEILHKIMTSCWIKIPDERIKANDLVSSLRQFQAEGGK